MTLSGSGFVICHEQNGQIAVEMAINRCCSLATFPSSVGQIELNPVSIELSEDPCPSCTDVLLTTDDFVVSQVSARGALWQVPTITWVATSFFQRSFYPILVQSSSRSPELTFCAVDVLSSTILRI